MTTYDMIIIGAGPGGYVAALRAADLGKKVALVEENHLGGTCLNAGCVPTKTLLREAHVADDFAAMHDRKEAVVQGQRQGIEALLKAAGVTVYKDQASIAKDKSVHLTNSDEILQGNALIIATGAVPALPPIPGSDRQGVVTSDDLLTTSPDQAQRLLIIGGGVIGVEMASLYAYKGTEVTIIEALPRLLGNMDKEIGQSLGMAFKKQGITVLTDAKVLAIEEGEPLAVRYVRKEAEVLIQADQVLIATGRKAATADLFQEGAAPELNRGFIAVNSQNESSIPGIYAIGDVCGGIQLAHYATAQGRVLVERLCGLSPQDKLDLIPACVYTQPEIASVGLDANQAKDQGIETLIGKYSMGGNAKTVIDDLGRSFIKLVFRADNHQLIGAQMVCGRASDLISIATLAMVGGLTAEDLASTVFPHPTYAEAIGEAAQEALGTGVHVMKRKR